MMRRYASLTLAPSTDDAVLEAAQCPDCGKALTIQRCAIVGTLRERCEHCRTPWRAVPRRLGTMPDPEPRVVMPRLRQQHAISARRERILQLLPHTLTHGLTIRDVVEVLQDQESQVRYVLRSLVAEGLVQKSEVPRLKPGTQGSMRRCMESVFWKEAA